jgi:hypothetical protein
LDSPFRRTLSFGLYGFSDERHRRRSHCCLQPDVVYKPILAHRTTGDMLFDSPHFSFGDFFQGVAFDQLERKVSHWLPRYRILATTAMSAGTVPLPVGIVLRIAERLNSAKGTTL